MAYEGSFDGSGLSGAPDIGTIGGNFGDESSATMGGALSPEQADANAQAMGSGWMGDYDFGMAGMASPFGFNSYNLANLFGSQFSTGLPTTPSDFAPSTSMSFSSFFDSPFGKLAKGLLSMTPTGSALVGLGNLATGNYGRGAAGLVGGLTGNGTLGSMAGMLGQGLSKEGLSGSQALGTMGSMAGGMLGGPVGSMVGGTLGGQLGKGFNGTSGPGQQGTGMNYGDLAGTLASGLAGIYSANQMKQAAGQNTMNLGDMFGPNSAYAQQLRQQLERKDAAAGRRSQYGPREVELQARLAQMAAQYGPNISQQNLQAEAIRNAQRNAQLNTLLGLGRSTGAFNALGRGLESLFSSGSAPMYSFGTGPDFGNQDLGQFF